MAKKNIALSPANQLAARDCERRADQLKAQLSGDELAPEDKLDAASEYWAIAAQLTTQSQEEENDEIL